LIFDLPAAVSLFSATTEVRDRFWMRRYDPHVAARKMYEWLQKFSFVTPKRLFQQNRPTADVGCWR
jgi:hypothetical protein